MPKAKQEYTEDPGWASAFHRPDNEDPQPRYTGQGLDANGDEIEIAVWVRRAKSGARYLRIKIQEPYDAEVEDDDLDEDEPEAPLRGGRLPRRRKRERIAAAKAAEPEEDEDDDDEIPF
jgi:hypothetical protein